jgi:predicted site-specific integrase-resolvase
MEQNVLIVREVADRFAVAASTVRLWLRGGLLPVAEEHTSEIVVPDRMIPESLARRFDKLRSADRASLYLK